MIWPVNNIKPGEDLLTIKSGLRHRNTLRQLIQPIKDYVDFAEASACAGIRDHGIVPVQVTSCKLQLRLTTATCNLQPLGILVANDISGLTARGQSEVQFV